MDRFDRIIRDIQQKTDDEVIHWRAVSAERYSNVVLNTFRVIRAFSADYRIANKEYELVFIERKIDYHDDFSYSTEGRGFELFVLGEGGQLVVSLYDGVVDRDDLLRLAGLIDAHNELVKQFFDAFDEPGAA
jgi:hypothetical protein